MRRMSNAADAYKIHFLQDFSESFAQLAPTKLNKTKDHCEVYRLKKGNTRV